MRSGPLKISLALNLQEIMNVIESLPEGHPLLPYLTGKRDTLLAVYRLKPVSKRVHEIWCVQGIVDKNLCTCLSNREGTNHVSDRRAG